LELRVRCRFLSRVDGRRRSVARGQPGPLRVNEPCRQDRDPSPEDIDKATKLGLGYPFGPLEWGDRIGAGRVLFILERLQGFYGEPRYRPNPWLKRRAALRLPLSAPEGRA
jgi:hypothetical protein